MQSTFLGHPTGLVTLFLTEACERFSYYGMRAILVLYLLDHFLFKESTAFEIVASYGAMVYFMPVIGGFVADRWLGFRKAVIFGAVLLCVGHLLMAIEGDGATVVNGEVVRDELALGFTFLAMSFIIVGVGFLKACISNMVGQLYSENDSRRDQGFTIFYLGINLGAFAAINLCGWLGMVFGWGYGFGAAGLVMLIGLVAFILGKPSLQGVGEPSRPYLLLQKVIGIRKEWLIYFLGVCATIFTALLLQQTGLVKYLLNGVGIVALVGVLIYAWYRCTREQLERIGVMLYLIVVSVLFWGLFEQAATSLKSFALRNLDTSLFGLFTFQPAQIESLNPAFIILLSPFFVLAWNALSKRSLEPTRPMKFGLGTILAGVGYGMFLLGCLTAGADFQVAMIWVVLGFLLITMGELCLSPVGLSMITRYSPVEMVGVMMGIWFLASSVGSVFAGFLAQFAAIDTAPDVEVDAATSLAVYVEAFTLYTWLGLAVGIVVVLSAFPLRRFLRDEIIPEERGELVGR